MNTVTVWWRFMFTKAGNSYGIEYRTLGDSAAEWEAVCRAGCDERNNDIWTIGELDDGEQWNIMPTLENPKPFKGLEIGFDKGTKRYIFVHPQGDGEPETVYNPHSIDIYDDALYAEHAAKAK